MNRKQLPKPLKDLDNFNQLTENQVSDFKNRLDYIEEIFENIESWLEGRSNWESLRLFLDDLELDVSVNVIFSSEGRKDNEIISSWLIHDTWFDDFELSQLKNALDLNIANFMNSQNPTYFSNKRQINEWLELMARNLRAAHESFYNSKNLESALAHYLAIDTLMAKLLSGLYLLRFAAYS